MRVQDIASKLDTRVLHSGAGAGAGAGAEVSSAVSSDRMSDLLEHASPSTLIVTNLATPQLLDMAELMDVPAVCVTAGEPPAEAFLEAARRARVAVIVSPLGAGETRRRLSDLLNAEAHSPP
jgi:hypothetical protein